MKKVAVIGSNSFSGSDFVDLLLEKGGYQVTGISRSPEKPPLFLPYKKRDAGCFAFHQIDLNRDLERLGRLLDAIEPEYIVNFAAQSEVAPSWRHPEQWFQTNAVALTCLANLLKDKKYLKRYVHISSPEVYGSCEGCLTEDAPLNPSTPYAASKAAGDLSLFTFYKNFGFPLVMIRATNVYGAHQQLFKIIPRSILSIQGKRKIELHGGGKAVKSYIHIRDVSIGEWAAMEQGIPGEIYHLSPDQGVEVREAVRLICAKMNASFAETVVSVDERLGQDKAYRINSSKARRAFGWSCRTSFEQGVQQTIDWVCANYAAILQHPLEYVHKQ